MSSTEMEKRVAKAAYAAVYDVDWDNAYEGHQEMCLTAARAAIRAMRTPSPTMMDAAMRPYASDKPLHPSHGIKSAGQC